MRFDGFLGTRASLMLDVVALAMLLVLPALACSVYLVKYRGRYTLHKQVQISLGLVLLLIMAVFEVDMRVNGWRDRAAASPYRGQQGETDWVSVALGVHLGFAVTTAALWALVLTRAWRGFASPARPGEHSAWHRRFGKLAAVDMLCTAVTGWIFYWLAFVA